MTSRAVYALVLLQAVVGITMTYALVSAQARWDAARYTRAELLDARAAQAKAEAAIAGAEQTRQQAEDAREVLEADYARFRASIGELLKIVCR